MRAQQCVLVVELARVHFANKVDGCAAFSMRTSPYRGEFFERTVVHAHDAHEVQHWGEYQVHFICKSDASVKQCIGPLARSSESNIVMDDDASLMHC